MATALVRDLPTTFDRAIVRGVDAQIDVDLARRQHRTYSERLATAGYGLKRMPSDPAHPDSVFVEDAAVVIGEVAVITRPGAPSRRGEVEPVAAILADDFHLIRIAAPATLDGGDVMILGNTLWVGRSSRTNEGGIRQLSSLVANLGMDCVPVEVNDVLHLKSAVLPIDGETVVVTKGTVNEERLGDLHIIYEAEHETHQFSALPLIDGTVLVSESAPETADRLFASGFEVSPIDVSQIQLADGGLTCMSILYG